MRNKKTSLFEYLHNAQESTSKISFLYSDHEVYAISYGQFYRRCVKLVQKLKMEGMQAGTIAILASRNIEKQITIFWACQAAGIIPVLISYKNKKIPQELFDRIPDCKVITDELADNDEWKQIATDLSQYDFTSEIDESLTDEYTKDAIPVEQTCCILLSSGTTSSIKIVPLTGRNLIASIRSEQRIASLSEKSKILAWMPFYHVGGLIIHHLTAAYLGCSIYIIPTEVYARDAFLWLRSINRYNITFSGTISSSLRSLMRRFQANPIANLSLSTIQMISVGAESVSAALCLEFEKVFSEYGLKKNTVVPTYGLTESSCLVGWAIHDNDFECYKPATEDIGIGNKAQKTIDTDSNAYPAYVMSDGCGLSVRDKNFKLLNSLEIGDIWLKGPMLINTYYDEMVKLKQFFRDGWFYTGDIGIQTESGKLVVFGRGRDLLKINGEFFSAIALENVIKEIPEKKVENVLVSEYHDRDGVNIAGIYIICKQWMMEKTFLDEFYRYCNRVRNVLTEKIGFIPCEIIPIPIAPKTDSQKIRRFELSSLVDHSLQERIHEKAMNINSITKNYEQYENELINIIMQVTGIEIPDRDGTFSDYGIVSKDVPRIVDQINKRFHADLGVASIFNHPSVKTLAKHIMEKVTDNSDVKAAKISSESINEDDPVVIVGMSCRFPGKSDSPEAFWEFLKSGVDGIVDIPEERWDADQYYSANDNEPGKMYCKKGGFIDADVKKFDANFFNISPKEAPAIDPHERLLLELTWEAFENAGLNIEKYSGTNTGVFLGLSNDEYGLSSINSGDLKRINSYSLTGICYSTACGRISYTFGFQGPCFSVDTACSSFLTALHLANRSIINHDADYAVVGGASLMLTPVIGVAFSKLHAVSHDGHCKTFDERADGYGRGEGAGVIVLKRLSEAKKDHDHILAVIRSTGINQDGKSNGLTAPNGESQKKVIENTLQKSGINPADVDYVEAHGTGTALGDPIEVNSIRDVYCDNVIRKAPLLIGSVKSNIGHLEAASGAASVIKVLLSMEHGIIPANYDFQTPSSKIKWTNNIKVVSENTPWENQGHPRRAAINSFGFGGSNAHIILEEYEENKSALPVNTLKNQLPYMIKLSAKYPEALKNLAKEYSNHLRALKEEELNDFLMTTLVGRANLLYRACIVGNSKEELIKGLNSYINEKKSPSIYATTKRKNNRKIAFLFTGQSSQYVNMARDLYENNKVFRDAFEKCEKLFKPYILCLLSDLIYSENANAETIKRTEYAQPLIFTIEYALGCFWGDLGIVPSMVIGHSIGEYAAAVFSNVLSLETAVQLVALRGRLMQACPGNGTMVTVFADIEKVSDLIKDYSDIQIAVHNSKELCVVSGQTDQVEDFVSKANAQNIKTKRLNVSHAFHSRMMRPAADQFYDLVKDNNFQSPTILFYSSMLGRKVREEEQLDGRYWSEHICNEVKFYEAMKDITTIDDYVLLEVGPTKTLTTLVKYIFDGSVSGINSLDVKAEDKFTITKAVSALYAAGCEINWDKWMATAGYNWVRKGNLPTNPFMRREYWNEMEYDRGNSEVAKDLEVNSILGERIESPAMENTVIFQKVYTPSEPFFMAEHVIFNTAIAPAAAYMALIIQAMQTLYNPASISIKEIELQAPLSVTDKRIVQICIKEERPERVSYQIVSRNPKEIDRKWTLHTKGQVVINSVAEKTDSEGEINTWRNISFDENGANEHPVYSAMTKAGFKLGSGFRCLKKSRRNADYGIFYIEPDSTLEQTKEYRIYPGVIDSVFHTMLCMVLDSALLTLGRKDSQTMIPYYIGEFTFNYCNLGTLWARTTAHIENKSIIGDTAVFNNMSEPVILIHDMITKMTNRKNLLGERNTVFDQNTYNLDWKEEKQPALINENEYASVVVLSDKPEQFDALKDILPADVYVQKYDADETTEIFKKLKKPALLLFAYGIEEKGNNYSPMKTLFSILHNPEIFKDGNQVSLRIVTQNAIGYLSSKINLSQALLWGFARSYVIENPDQCFGIVDIDNGIIDEKKAYNIVYGKATEQCLREDKVYTSVLRKHSEFVNLNKAKQNKIIIRNNATYIVAGGTGFVGKTYIRALINKGAEYIAVLSRHIPEKNDFEEEKNKGVEVRYYSADILKKEEVVEAINRIQKEMPEIRGVIQATGVFRDQAFRNLTWENFKFVVDPKLTGTLNLYEAIKGLPIDIFGMTSSITSLFGNFGQTNYGAGNYFLNSLSEKLNLEKVPASVICWGPWEGSKIVSDVSVRKGIEQGGLNPLSPEECQKIIEVSFEHYCSALTAVSADWNKYVLHNSSEAIINMLDNSVEAKKEPEIKEDVIKELQDMRYDNKRQYLREKVASVCKNVMGYNNSDILDFEASFNELGADSLMIFSMRTALQDMLHVQINVSDFYSYTTINSMTDHIFDDILQLQEEDEIDESIDSVAKNLEDILND